jgi:hypothetical protein
MWTVQSVRVFQQLLFCTVALLIIICPKIVVYVNDPEVFQIYEKEVSLFFWRRKLHEVK